ncbi:MAG: outer membrane beta-barrel protein [Comamonadaceae bacterium]|nr:outer membrane beta-barrel protein [Comamonadaceae bacterium]
MRWIFIVKVLACSSGSMSPLETNSARTSARASSSLLRCLRSRGGGRTKADGINISLVGKLPLNPAFNLLGKIGTTYSRTDVSSDPTSGVVAGSEQDFGVSYGIGVEYAFTRNWSAALQFESHDMKFAGDRNDHVAATTLSVRYRY